MTSASAESPVTEEGAKWIVRFGRLGYAAKGLVYVVMGILATRAAIGSGGKTTDSQGAIREIGAAPFGRIALIVVAVGLLGYAAWRLVSAMTDAERRGDEPSSLLLRLGDAIRGAAYGALGVWTLRYLAQGYAESTDHARSLTNKALSLPAGRFIVVGAGLGIVGYALYQLYRAVTRKFLKRLNLSSAGSTTRTLVERLGGFGVGARAMVFGTVGLLLARAGWNYDPSSAGGIDDSLDAIANGPAGILLFIMVATGLIAFGVLQIATARYRVMRAA
ncbi:MAG TPA: DUF1206 domain-containing protein [Gemmatimonadaceae bacterium]|nr:DUF1206 domain-containing protein [Gemmatimonadaceae bacterium]